MIILRRTFNLKWGYLGITWLTKNINVKEGPVHWLEHSFRTSGAVGSVLFVAFLSLKSIISVFYFLYKDGLRELERLAEFLDVTIDDELKNEITRMCSFEKMRDDKDLGEILSNDFLQKGYSFFRKGIFFK